MILLWLIVALFSALVMAMLMFPLLRGEGPGTTDRAAYDLTVYKDQLAEIDRDLARGLLTEDQAAAARVEVQRRILAVAGPEAARAATGTDAAQGPAASARADGRVRLLDLVPRAIEQGPWGLATLAAIVAVVPIGALALYLVVGSPMLPGQPHAERIEQAEREALSRMPPQLRAEIETLLEVIDRDHDNARAWFELGRAYRRADQHDRAVEALRTARDLGLDGPDRPIMLAELGESMMLSEQGRITERTRQLFLDAVRIDSDEPRARFYLGMAAAQAGEPERALAIWRDLSAQTPADAPWAEMLRQSIAMVGQRAGIPPATVEPAHPLTLEAGQPVKRTELPEADGPTDGDAAPAPDAGAQMRADADRQRTPGDGFSDDEQAMIEGMVEGLAARLEENPEDVDGWMRLAQSYGVLGRWDEAIGAAERAAEQAPEDPAVLTGLADTLMTAARAEGAGEPPARVFGLFETVLEHDPLNPQALYFVGLSAAQDGDTDRARTLWGRLLERMPEDEPAYAAIKRQLDALPANGATQ
ncbi:c-type cytochrome biogenesis protein CcmI [Roseospira goensis]|uniref:Cytochrome c-type biogenesis protein CcmH n=1 Tax=Roseospira goensis TaxID=391922 RepID=A0A7W6WL41_9PROT|nr:c-type cytochrome biogenesis protein CcmI [Roseospira goensis]MBB4286303.1 cytochrome c-type biogenesis protein CcmH [Roseospira goensis]